MKRMVQGNRPPGRFGRGALRRRVAMVALLVVLGPVEGTAAAGPEAVALTASTITDTDSVWQLTTEERGRVYPLRVEGRVNFYDPSWGSLWYEQGGVGKYLRLSSNAPLMRNGQRVRIEGTLIPNQGLVADRVKVTVLSEYEPVAAVPTAGRITEVRSFDRKVVVTEGYVDEQQLIDSQHLRLVLLVEDRRVICWVPPDPNSPLPDWQGATLRVKAVYSGRLDPTGTEATVEHWVARASDVQLLGSIASDPKFAGPVVGTVDVSGLPVGSWVKLRGHIRRRELGTSFVLRDGSGEILVESLQRERMPQGAEIEVVGRTAVSGSRWTLQSARFRRALMAAAAAGPESPTLDRVERVRELTAAEAETARPVDVRGVVTWSLPEADFFFLQDLSGGVRVRLPQGAAPPPLQQYVRVEGVSGAGAFGPAVELRQLHTLGSMAHPFPKRISYSQAISGSEDGQWVEMRGFIRRTASEGDWRWICVTTPEGEFVGHLWSPVNFVATPGSLLRVRGVCEVTADAKNQISGVRLRVPFLHDIIIEEDAPAELYDLPLRPLVDLRQLFSMEEMVRARISAQVVHHVPGQYVVVQQGDHGLTVFSREPGQLTPGDTIEAVGIVGYDGARMVLRESVFRRMRVAPAPAPMPLVDTAGQDFRHDLRLVRVRGTVLDYSRHADALRLTLQADGTIFDASLDYPAGAVPRLDLQVGMLLELTGIYRIAFDDFDRPRGFQIQLRSEADATVVAMARFWTAGRALAAAGGLGGGMLFVFGWVMLLRHRVRTQTEQIRQQMEKQNNLESELERAQRFRSLGLLAGGLAHDFNNLLTGILGNVTLAMLDEKVLPLVGDCLRDVETSAKRARDLTHQLVTFAKGGDPLRETLALDELLHNAAGFALSGSKSRADIRHEPGLWAVHADRNQLGRALQNLIVHARGAMPEGGIITIEAANETLPAHTGALAPGRYVQIRIIDRGPGLPAERLPGFFDPYASTKFGDDRFSLAIAYSIVKRHGGNLEVESAPGTGTVFRLWVPAGPEQPATAAPTPTTAVVPVDIAGTRVLLMDDEETIRRLGERLLTRLNCEIRTVPDGEACVQAYREAQAAGRGFQIVILDLTVPGGMGGKECMAALLALDPEVRAIVSSGYSNDPVMANYRQHGFRAVVPKPYAVGVLAEAITRVLGAPRSGPGPANS